MHKLLVDEPGKKMLLLGNEAIVRGALEAGVSFAATYPGTPSSEISLNFFHISNETDFYFEYSTNESVALEVVAAAANSGLRAMCIMKHVGVNVAADALMTLAYVGVRRGMVIISADDPFMFSSQNEQDNRLYGKLSGLPIIEPTSIDEAKALIPYAFEISEKTNEPVIFRTTTRINHSNGIVTLGQLTQSKPKGHFDKDPMNFVTVPAVSRKLHVKLLENYDKAQALSEASPYNTVTGKGELGIICNGVSYNYVIDAISDLKKNDQIQVLKIGFSHPLPERKIHDFLITCNKVLIVEEGEPYMEEMIKAIAQDHKITIPIKGKTPTLFSKLYEFNPGLVREKIAFYFDVPYEKPPMIDLTDAPELPQRPPNLCAGCSHRATYYAVKKAAEKYDVVFPTDIGCYTLGFLPPLSMGDFLICMGSSIGTACGFAKATDQKVIAFIGDSTFFHSGVPGLINAVHHNHDLTLVILDNGTTAMTGHQPHPGVDMEALNFEGYKQVSIEKIVTAIGVEHLASIKPYQINKSIKTIQDAVAHPGVSVIISRELCTLYAKGLKKLKDRAFKVNQKCKNHRTCINELACPAFIIDNGVVKINADQCTGCSVCAQICPENAIVPLKK